MVRMRVFMAIWAMAKLCTLPRLGRATFLVEMVEDSQANFGRLYSVASDALLLDAAFFAFCVLIAQLYRVVCLPQPRVPALASPL